MIRIILQEYEVNAPGKGNYYYLRCEITDEGYCGWSNVVIAESHLRAFYKELKDFSRELRGTPELSTGWGNEVYFRLHFEKWKSTGTLWISGEIATPAHRKIITNAPCSHRFLFGFPTDPAQLDSFMANLALLIDGTRKETILDGKKE